jgi:hypothetical protein
MAEQVINPDLDSVHDALVDQVNALSEKLGDTSDPDLAQAIVTEMREVTHRVDIVQSLLFTAASNKIASRAADVKTASNDLTKSLDQITGVTSFVKDVTTFLTIVDKAIDLAKVL